MNNLKESIELNPVGECRVGNIGIMELRGILREYFGNNKISYTADHDVDLWGKVMSYLEKETKFIKDIELSNGIVYIYETDVVNEFLVRYESEKGINFLFWSKKESQN